MLSGHAHDACSSRCALTDSNMGAAGGFPCAGGGDAVMEDGASPPRGATRSKDGRGLDTMVSTMQRVVGGGEPIGSPAQPQRSVPSSQLNRQPSQSPGADGPPCSRTSTDVSS
jgi:hypothetical protein